ncbi:glycosyltransferase family 39 protein [Shewanella submarina]|uniref:ArnT family glycosyltransferase n=1 Tax=Shewanella submarina TaxID=2016376 RepID=A0ABV7G863_9GAMM|nr:glycosyltransferase family 39 protein [Shewanella submarina]MCL1038576.1 glycosyltransferase family 39 protein [Shewanella submarina]
MLKSAVFRIWWCIALLLVIRLVSLGAYPLMDTTEARYGEMVRLMLDTGNWLTPQFDIGVPFWGKPPMFVWMSAAASAVLGVGEFALRLPHFLAGVGVLGCIYWLAGQLSIRRELSLLVLASTVVFIVSAGAIMTDMALTFGLTLAMLGFISAWQANETSQESSQAKGKLFGYLGFVGLAIGLLSKGPLILVLMGISVVLFLVWQYGPISGWQRLWRNVPWFSGLLLMLAIALPWYWMAEQATPGFINYFIVGEHFLRFVDGGWQGDLYGSAHEEVRGTIWLFFVIAAMPWSLLLPMALWRLWQVEGRRFSWQSKVLICWMLSPLLLFTLAGNILPAYVLPGIPAMALLIARGMAEELDLWAKRLALGVCLLLVGAVAVVKLQTAKDKSEKWLLAQREQPLPTFYWQSEPFSSRFYTSGQAQLLTSDDQLRALFAKPGTDNTDDWYLVADKQVLATTELFQSCDFEAENRKRVLMLCQREGT